MAVSELQARASLGQAAGATDTPLFFDDEARWLTRVRETLEQETAEELGAAAKVFDVPRALRDTKPEAYAPHHFALGPYHHGRPELRDMERYKLAAAKRVESGFDGDRKIVHLVHCLLEDPSWIRAPYHRLLDLRPETLGWMMAVDACFLLDFLENYQRKEAPDMLSSADNWINAVVQDAMMLENQLPLLVFAKTLEFRQASDQVATDVVVLHNLFERFIRLISPIKICNTMSIADFNKQAHLLELLYHFVVPSDVFKENCGGHDPPALEAGAGAEETSLELGNQLPADYDKVKQACTLVSSLNVAPVRFVKEKLISRPISVVSRLGERIMRKAPVLSAVVPLVGKLMASAEVQARLNSVSLESINHAPLAQEIKIPSVEQLVRCGVRFMPATQGIAGISFDAATATLSLPVITLDGNTEVILRNLVAYEAVTVRGPLVLARYTELMNGIIDTAKDVKILRQSRVVRNHMKSSKDAASMWNGMCRATRLSAVPQLDGVIRAVNAHRDKTASVWAQKLLKKYVFRSWKILTLLASLLLLLMTALQTLCSTYPCQKTWFGGIMQSLNSN